MMPRLACIAFAALCLSTNAIAEPTRVSRGISASVEFTHDGNALFARSDQTLESPLIVRLRRTPETNNYTATFIGSTEGTYNLSDWLVHEDGTPATRAPTIEVAVVSNLPIGHGTDVFGASTRSPRLIGGYRFVIVTFALMWISVPIIYAYRRYRNRPSEQPVEAAAPPPTLADQLRPLVENAANRTLTTDEQGRLELMLMMFWRERLGLSFDEPVASLRRMRSHPEAGQLLTAIESWLHRASGPQLQPEELRELLAPYRMAPTVQLHQEPAP